MAKDKDEHVQKIANVWNKMMSPLRGLTQQQITQMLENARHGNDVRMQLSFFEMERQTPIYQVCLQKRLAGVQNRKWEIQTLDDSPEAQSQKEFVQNKLNETDLQNEDGLTDAIRHLCLATFRGRSAFKTFFSDDGKVFFKKLQNWNVLEYNGNFYWNPNVDQCGWLDDGKNANLVLLPKDEICYLLEERPVDIPGLGIYLRQLVGEQQWARFVEKCGIPQVLLNAPEGTPDTALDLWNARAQQIFEGGSGTLPSGTNVNLLTEARGQDPFSSYIQHQMEMISILATGGTLMTIGGSTGLGSDLAAVQKQSFDDLVSYDCKRISNALTHSVVRKIVKHFLNQELKCRFVYTETDDTTTAEYLDMAAKLQTMGVALDIAKLANITGISFIKDEQQDIWKPKSEQQI